MLSNVFSKKQKPFAKLDHPNIVRIYDIENEQDAYFIVMEYIEGKSVSQILEEKESFGIYETLRIGIKVAEALASAHETKIIHRDVKPANIMISNDLDVKLTDFGLARTIDNSINITGSGDVLGTPIYVAPEYIKEGVLDPRVDLYSLGITLFHMLTGNPPIQEKIPLPSFTNI